MELSFSCAGVDTRTMSSNNRGYNGALIQLCRGGYKDNV